MWFSGVLPADAPDPRAERRDRVRALPFATYGFVPQPSLEERDLGLTEGRDGGGPTQTTVGISYTLWRNPEDHDDPVNLAELTDRERAQLDAAPPWPRPAWLVEQVAWMKHRMLWEVVNTTWTREQWEFATLPQQLTQHVNHILMNHFRIELGIPDGPPTGTSFGDEPWRARPSAANPRARLNIDGVATDAIEIDTDPFVYGIGARLTPETVVTVAIPRAKLAYVRIALARREPGGTGED